MQAPLRAINAHKPFGNIKQPRIMPVFRVVQILQDLLWEALALIGNSNMHALPFLRDAQFHPAVIHRSAAMPHSVFNQRLDNQRRQAARIGILRDVCRKMDRIHKARLRDREIVFHIVQLRRKRNEFLVDAERLPVIIRKDEQEASRLTRVRAAQGRNGVERIAEEMRVDLRLKSAELRLAPQRDLMFQVVQFKKRGKEPCKAFSKYETSAEATNATGANIQLMKDGDAEIAIAMQDAVMQAYTATGAYEGKEAVTSLRALMRLWPNYVQLVTTADTGIHSVEDLRGKRVGVGAANSGVEINARMILNAYGITYDDIQPDYLAYGEAIDNMKNGQCDAVFVTSGLPNATVMELAVSYDMVLVPIDGEGRDKLVSDYPYYAKMTIPADTYNNTEDIEGVFVYNIMLVREDLSEKMLYDMLTGIFEHIDTIQASHNAANKNIYLEVGVDDIQLPLHPGAEAFWKEKGYLN